MTRSRNYAALYRAKCCGGETESPSVNRKFNFLDYFARVNEFILRQLQLLLLLLDAIENCITTDLI
jgi:hypothetical protein